MTQASTRLTDFRPMRVQHLSPDAEARLGVSLDGWAVSLDQQVVGLGDTPLEAIRDARDTVAGPLPPDAIVAPITEAARSRVMDWGAAVANLRTVGGVLCTRPEGVAMRVVHDWFERRVAA